MKNNMWVVYLLVGLALAINTIVEMSFGGNMVVTPVIIILVSLALAGYGIRTKVREYLNLRNLQLQVAKMDEERASEKLKLQCICIHRRKNGDYALDAKSKKLEDGRTIIPCALCGKNVDISPIDEEEMANALNVIDKLYDIAKLRANISSKNDMEIVREISTMQYKLHNTRRLYDNTHNRKKSDKL